MQSRGRLLAAAFLALTADIRSGAAEPVSFHRPARSTAAHPGPRRDPLPSLRYREAMGHAVVVPVRLNGQGPFDLVLDTATRFTTLDPGLAGELGLEPLGQLPVVTLAGVREATRCRLRQLTLGPIELTEVDVLSAPVPVLRNADRRIRGFLGQTALARLSFGLDHSRRLVLFARPSRADAVLPLEEREGRAAVSFSPKRSTATLSLVLDSGVPAPVLFEKGNTPLPLERVPGHFEAETSSGATRLSMARLEGRVGTLALPATLAAVQEDAAAGRRQEDGLLPTRSFRVVFFDRVQGQLLLDAR
jgi:hypothetical protein